MLSGGLGAFGPLAPPPPLPRAPRIAAGGGAGRGVTAPGGGRSPQWYPRFAEGRGLPP